MLPGNQGQVSGPSVPPDGDLLGEIYSFVSKWTGLEDICLKCGCFTVFVLICVLTLCPRKQEDLSTISLYQILPVVVQEEDQMVGAGSPSSFSLYLWVCVPGK